MFCKIVKYLLLLFIAINASAANNTVQLRKNWKICYFTLNNEKEFHATKEYFEKQNSAKNTYTVEELLPYGEYPDRALIQAIKNGIECDALVLSGHHRKEGFDGQLVPGQLSIKTIQNFSCEPKMQDWFKKVKVLWLQACATHDQYSRYFPNAIIFSWNGSAPSKIAHRVIPLQLEQAGSKNLENLFTQNNVSAFVSSWNSFRAWNNSASTELPYYSKDQSIKEELQLAECSLHEVTENKNLDQAIQTLEKFPNDLWNQVSSWEKAIHDSDFSDVNKKTLTKIAKSLLKKNMKNISIPVHKKILVYRLLTKISGFHSETWDQGLQMQATAALSKRLIQKDEVERRRYYSEIISAMLELEIHSPPLLTSKIIETLENNEAIENILRVILLQATDYREQYLLAIAKNPNSNSQILYSLAWHVRAYRPTNSDIIISLLRRHSSLTNKVYALIQNQ